MGRLGPRMGRRIRQMTASASTTCPRTPISLAAFSQVRARLALGDEGRPQQDSNLRSRLRSPDVRSSEFVHPACADSIAHLAGGRDHSAYIPDHETPRDCPHCAGDDPRPVRAGSAWPLVSDRSVRRGSGVKRDFACTFTRHFPSVVVVLHSESRLGLEGRTRKLSGSSPDLDLARAPALSVCWSGR
jgi:hypothetical protein